MDKPGFSVYNIGLGKSYSVRELHGCAERVLNRKIPVRESEPRPGDPAVLCASPQRLITELGWSPQHSDLTNILETAWAWKQKYHARVRQEREK